MRGGIALAAAMLAFAAVDASAAGEVLTIGRQVDASASSDVSERVMTEALARAGIGVVFKRLPLPRSIEEANEGTIDGDLQRVADVSAAYPNLVVVPTAINRIDVAVYGASPSIADKTRAEVHKLRIAVTRGSVGLVRLTQGMTVVNASTRDAAIEMMVNGRADITMGAYIDIQPRIRDGALKGLYVWPYVWFSGPMYFTLNRRHEALVPRINAVLQRMAQDGVIDRYYEEGLRSLKLPLLRNDGQMAPDLGPGTLGR